MKSAAVAWDRRSAADALRRATNAVSPLSLGSRPAAVTEAFVDPFDNGSFLLDVSVLGPGTNLITAANGSLSTDTFVRQGGTGQCVL